MTAESGEAPGARVHLAGHLVDGVQLCERCGFVLNNYRYVMYTGPPPRGWEPGRFVLVDGPSKRVCDEGEGIPCTETVQ